MTTMITHVYRCPDKRHGEFDSAVDFGADVPPTARCPVGGTANDLVDSGGYNYCGRESPWVPQVVTCIWRCVK